VCTPGYILPPLRGWAATVPPLTPSPCPLMAPRQPLLMERGRRCGTADPRTPDSSHPLGVHETPRELLRQRSWRGCGKPAADDGRARMDQLLGSVLVQSGRLSPEQLANGMAQAAREAAPLGDALAKLGYVSPDEILEAIGEYLGLPMVSLAETPPDPAAVGL